MVTGRACRTKKAPSLIAHSMSCGWPSSAATVRAQRATSRGGAVVQGAVAVLSRDPRTVVVDDPLLGGDDAGDQAVAEPGHRVDHDLVRARDRVDRERDAGRVGADHPLHDDAHRAVGVREAPAQCPSQIGDAGDVEDGGEPSRAGAVRLILQL